MKTEKLNIKEQELIIQLKKYKRYNNEQKARLFQYNEKYNNGIINEIEYIFLLDNCLTAVFNYEKLHNNKTYQSIICKIGCWSEYLDIIKVIKKNQS